MQAVKKKEHSKEDNFDEHWSNFVHEIQVKAIHKNHPMNL